MNISKEDYIKLLTDLANDQYTSKDVEDTVKDMGDAWFPAESPAKERMIKSREFTGTVDCLNLKKDQIIAAINKNKNLSVGPFTIRIRGFYTSEKNKDSFMTIDLYEWRTKTPSGHECRMDFRVNVLTDSRFEGRPWLTSFNNSQIGKAYNIPLNTVVDIVKWLQVIRKLAAFL